MGNLDLDRLLAALGVLLGLGLSSTVVLALVLGFLLGRSSWGG
jgi:hypothetical protein